MARPRSELTKFILSLSLDLPAREVLRKASQKGLKTTEANVHRVRAMVRRQTGESSRGRAANDATKDAPAMVAPSTHTESGTAPLSKSDFIRSRPRTATAAEVIRVAASAGLTITPQLVYRVRAEGTAPREVAATVEAVKQTPRAVSGRGGDHRPPRSAQPVSPTTSGERAAPVSTLADVDDLIRAAADDEVGRETSAIAALRAALAAYEAMLVGVARARVVARVAAALNLGAPAHDVPDVSKARATLVEAMDALHIHLRPIQPSSREDDDASSVDSEEDPAPVEANDQTAGLDRDHLALFAVEAPLEGEVVVVPEIEGAPTPPVNIERAQDELEQARVFAEPETLAPLTKQEVRSFFERLVDAPPAPAARPTSSWERERDALRALLGHAAPMGDLRTDASGLEELDALDGITADTTSWTTLSRPVQHLWLSFLVARARRLKDWTNANVPAARKRMNEVIVRLPTFAHDARPGHINGMRPDHVPARASWEADAEALLSELRAVLAPPDAAPASIEDTPKPRKKTANEKMRSDSQPIDWPLRERVGKMRVLLFGGEPREEARQNVQRVLGIAALEWPESGKPRRVDALTASIANGKHDVVLVLRGFVAHAESKRLVDAAKQNGTPYAFVDSGYGTVAVREAIEFALQGR